MFRRERERREREEREEREEKREELTKNHPPPPPLSCPHFPYSFSLSSIFLGKLTVAQEASIKAKSTKAHWNIAKREIDLEKQADKIRTYKEAFAKIKQATGIESISEMVDEFVQSEDQNFALFNQINNLHREIEQ